jgi:hypothetical protein
MVFKKYVNIGQYYIEPEADVTLLNYTVYNYIWTKQAEKRCSILLSSVSQKVVHFSLCIRAKLKKILTKFSQILVRFKSEFLHFESTCLGHSLYEWVGCLFLDSYVGTNCVGKYLYKDLAVYPSNICTNLQNVCHSLRLFSPYVRWWQSCICTRLK